MTPAPRRRRAPRKAAAPAAPPPLTPEEQTYRVAKLRTGTVIDRLDAGTAMICLGILGNPGDGIVTLGMNLPSKTLGRKDILKLENRVLTASELARVALFGPHAIVAVIEDFRVVRRTPLELTAVLDGVVSCPNPSCITHHDPVPSRIRVEEREPLRLRCHYCERRIRRNEIRLL